MRRKNWKIKTKNEINFFQFSKIEFLKYKFEENSFFKFLKMQKNAVFIFQEIDFLNYTFYTPIIQKINFLKNENCIFSFFNF